MKERIIKTIILGISCSVLFSAAAQKKPVNKFKVIAFYTAKQDLAHISFVHEANQWFPKMAATYHFTYDSTNNWNNLNDSFLVQYQVVIFLDTRPDSLLQRTAFEKYIKRG